MAIYLYSYMVQNMVQKSSKNIENGTTNHQKSTKNWQKMLQNPSQEASWRLLGGPWGGLGGILAPRRLQEPKRIQNGRKSKLEFPLLGLQNPTKIDPKVIKTVIQNSVFFGIVFGLIFDGFWKPKSTKNPSTIDQKNDQKLHSQKERIFDWFLLEFWSFAESAEGQIHWKTQYFWMIFTF